MSTINLVAIAIALAAAIGFAFSKLSDPWFFGLVALATMVGAAGEAYHENNPGAVRLLALSGVLCLVSLRASWRDSRGRAGRR